MEGWKAKSSRYSIKWLAEILKAKARQAIGQKRHQNDVTHKCDAGWLRQRKPKREEGSKQTVKTYKRNSAQPPTEKNTFKHPYKNTNALTVLRTNNNR